MTLINILLKRLENMSVRFQKDYFPDEKLYLSNVLVYTTLFVTDVEFPLTR